MLPAPPPAGVLISLQAALNALLDGVTPVIPRLVPCDEALGLIAAAMPALAMALPRQDTAASDGWACFALDLVGASAYSPVALTKTPKWVEIGDVMPSGCDCVIHADLVEVTGPIAQAFGETAPGSGVRRRGEDMAQARPPIIEGRTIGLADLLVARVAGLGELAVRRPCVRLINVSAANSDTITTQLLTQCLSGAGALITAFETAGRTAAAIASALAGDDSDLIVMIGGTGEGRIDATSEALATRGALIAHRIALRPGGTSAIGRIGSTPLIALPGSPDQAFAAFLALVQPVIDHLSGRRQRSGPILPLARKISSVVGMSEIVLLSHEQGQWRPLAIGDFSLEAMRLADAWLVVSGDSEGYPAGMAVSAMPLRDSN